MYYTKGMARTVTLPNLIQLRLSDGMARQIDDWRRGQADIPTRSEAIRRLVETGLNGGADDAGAPTAWDMLAALYESDPDWRDNFGWEDKPGATISEAVAYAKAVARKKGAAAALEGAADLYCNESPLAAPIKALLARLDPEAAR